MTWKQEPPLPLLSLFKEALNVRACHAGYGFSQAVLSLYTMTLRGNPFSVLGSSVLLVPGRGQALGHMWVSRALAYLLLLAVM